MKKILIVLVAALVSLLANAQDFPKDINTGKITYTDVVRIDSTTKKETFYSLAKQLCSTKENIKTDNPNEFTFVFKASVPVKYPSPIAGMNHSGSVEYIVTVMCKDGRYKYTITDFMHVSQTANGGHLEAAAAECGKHLLTNAGWAAIKKQTFEHMDKFVMQLKQNMRAAQPAAPAKEDW